MNERVLTEALQLGAKLGELKAGVERLRAENSDLKIRVESLKTENAPLYSDRIANLERENICDVCAGTGNVANSEGCICGGSGKASDAVCGLRAELIRTERERDALQAQLNQIATAQSQWSEEGSISGGETWHGFAMRLQRLARKEGDANCKPPTKIQSTHDGTSNSAPVKAKAGAEPPAVLSPYYSLLNKLREKVDQGGYDGWSQDGLHVRAADAIEMLGCGLTSQIQISNNIRSHVTAIELKLANLECEKAALQERLEYFDRLQADASVKFCAETALRLQVQAEKAQAVARLDKALAALKAIESEIRLAGDYEQQPAIAQIYARAAAVLEKSK